MSRAATLKRGSRFPTRQIAIYDYAAAFFQASMGDDVGTEAEPDMQDIMDQVMEENAEHKRLSRTVPNATNNGTFSNKKIRWNQDGLSIEADTRHVKKRFWENFS